MTARIWHGTSPAVKADAYFYLVKRSGVPGYEATPGNQGVYVLHRLEGDQAHFLTLTFWDWLQAIQEFAGEHVEKAKYYPKDKDFLLEFEPSVAHCEVLSRPA
jgi:heme-degrading monooxygenase HmoA